MALKYGIVAFLMATWKWFYYAPNTYKELVIAEMRRKGEVRGGGGMSRKGGEVKPAGFGALLLRGVVL